MPISELALLLETRQRQESLPLSIAFGPGPHPLDLKTCNQMYLRLNCVAHYDTIAGIGDLADMKVIKNKFQLPRVVSYKDYINTGYEDAMSKHREARAEQKAKKLREKNAAIFAHVGKNADEVRQAEKKDEEEAAASTKLVTVDIR